VNVDELLKKVSQKLAAFEKDYGSQVSSLSDTYKLNFFKILKLQNKELIHSRFISFFLNPNESHGYGRLFIECFLKILKIPITFQCKGVKTEHETKSGRIDIFIENEDDKEQPIIVENKIHAIDQNEQLKRYQNVYQDSTLVYLTLNGKKASKRSLVDIKEGEYTPLSYEDHIISWIRECINGLYKENQNYNKVSFLLCEILQWWRI
jgi:hypothetical protein